MTSVIEYVSFGGLMFFCLGFAFLMIALILIKNILGEYFRTQRLKFTQAEVKDRRREIEKIQKNISYSEGTIRSIFNVYNDLIIGIYEGLYDERYVKMTIGQEILVFYQYYGTRIASNDNRTRESMAMEMMLKKWDGEGFMFDSREYKHGGIV